MGIHDRLRRLEERGGRGRGRGRRFKPWAQVLAGWECERNRLMPPDVRHARSLIALFRMQYKLAAMSADELIERIMDWRPLEERRRHAVEREVALSIYRGEPDTADMGCAPEWRESFVAFDELIAETTAVLQQGVSEAEILAGEQRELTDLEKRAYGPDRELIDEDEIVWRILDYGDPIWSDERLWPQRRHARERR